MAKFSAIMSLFVFGGTASTILLMFARRFNPNSAAGLLADDIAHNAVWLAFAVALGTTLGSLYLSEIAHFTPCVLCWYQRICMYPLAAALLVGGLRRDGAVWNYVLPPALIGAVIAIYHTQLQAFPHQRLICSPTEPCTIRYIWEFGFVSIPFMSLSAFAFIITMMVLATREAALPGSTRSTQTTTHPTFKPESHEQAPTRGNSSATPTVHRRDPPAMTRSRRVVCARQSAAVMPLCREPLWNSSPPVLIPHSCAALVVAVEFDMLEALHAGRIDPGLGRGSRNRSEHWRLCGRMRPLRADEFPDQLRDVFMFFEGTHRPPTHPPTDYRGHGARQAAREMDCSARATAAQTSRARSDCPVPSPPLRVAQPIAARSSCCVGSRSRARAPLRTDQRVRDRRGADRAGRVLGRTELTFVRSPPAGWSRAASHTRRGRRVRVHTDGARGCPGRDRPGMS